MMHNVKRYSIGALLLLVPALIAWSVATPPMQLEPASRLWVKGTSSVRAFECQAAVFDAQIATAGSDAVAAVLAGEKGIDAVAVTIAADKLDCRNGTMNGHMLKAIKATEHPTITFTLASYELARVEENLQVEMKGTLTLGGTAREVIVTATANQGADGTLQVVGSHVLSMKDFGLKPPSLMLGTMKVHDKLTVGFDLILKN
jgi:polyisoprenoid-binding protein YceI